MAITDIIQDAIEFTDDYKNAVIPDNNYQAINGTRYYPKHNDRYEKSIKKIGCNMMIVDTISDINDTINKTFVYTDGANLGTTKHLLSTLCEFQEYHISNHTPTTAKSIKSTIKLQNLLHVHCEID